jgi:hypothetical protein
MHKKWLLVAAGAGVPAVLVYLYAFPPGQGMPYPPCWFHALTGLHCPGCGATRCANALLHGDLAQAAAYNALLLACLPFVLLAVLRRAFHAARGGPAPPPILPRWCWAGIAAAVLLFGVLRNLPLEPFRLLAPHQL